MREKIGMDKNPTKLAGLTLEPSNSIKPNWDNYLQKKYKKEIWKNTFIYKKNLNQVWLDDPDHKSTEFYLSFIVSSLLPHLNRCSHQVNCWINLGVINIVSQQCFKDIIFFFVIVYFYIRFWLLECLEFNGDDVCGRSRFLPWGLFLRLRLLGSRIIKWENGISFVGDYDY